MKSIILLSTIQIVIRIAAIIASVEFLIMLAFGIIPYHLNMNIAAILDVIFLTIFSSPLIYIWVIKPFVSARDEALAHINHLANVDPLTHLANRRLLYDYLEKYIASCHRQQYYAGLLLIDLDGFKLINDSYGHGAGDEVLIEIAKRLQSVTRAEDVVSRMGGDEFVVLISHLGADEKVAREKVLHIAQNLIKLASKEIDYNSKKLQVGASIGIHLIGPEKLDIETTIMEVDSAMYRAKKDGKGRAVFLDDSIM